MRRHPIVPALFTLFAFSLCFTLGAWQLKRLEWKEGLLARIEQAQQLPPLGILSKDEAELTGQEFRRVSFKGIILANKPLFLAGRSYAGTGGYYLLNPLELWDGRLILVNRGFIPQNKRSEFETGKNIKIRIEGLLRAGKHEKMFAPKNRPDRNVWFWEDIPAIEQYLDVKLLPMIIEVTGEAKAGVYPIPLTPNTKLRNDHLGYAITWFALAVISLVMFAFWRRQQRA